MENKKVVLKLDLDDGKAKRKAMKTVASLSGIELIAVEMKEKKLTVIGNVDPLEVVSKLRKLWRTDLLTVGLVKEPEKNKDKSKNKGGNIDDGNMDEKEKQFVEKLTADLIRYYRNYNPYMNQNQYYYAQSAEENPDSCVIS